MRPDRRKKNSDRIRKNPETLFLFRLALALGQPDPYALAAALPASVFNDWRRYYLIEPFGQWRDNYHAGTISAILANVNRGKGQDPYGAADFFYMDPDTRAEFEEEKATRQMQQFISGLQARAENQAKKGPKSDRQAKPKKARSGTPQCKV